MNKGMVLIAVAVFSLIIFQLGGVKNQTANTTDAFPKLPAEPGFIVSQAFDGQWVGERFDTSGDKICSPTAITGVVKAGKASLKLKYNSTLLEGWIAENGDLVLYANNYRWDYRFVGKANQHTIEGKWHLPNGPCYGTWYVKRHA